MVPNSFFNIVLLPSLCVQLCWRSEQHMAAEAEPANKSDVAEGKRGMLQTIPVLADKGILRKLANCRSLSFC